MEEKINFTDEEKELFKQHYGNSLLYTFNDDQQMVYCHGAATRRNLAELSYETVKIQIQMMTEKE